MDEVVLPRRVVPQPVPFLDTRQEGDCGACVLAGLLACSVEDAYDRYLPARNGFNHRSMRQALYDAEASGLLDRVCEYAPFFPTAVYDHAWGLPAASMSLPWFSYFQMAVDAGYYGIALVNFEAKGYPHAMDHFVLFCGARTRRVPCEGGGARYEQEILISCSSTRSPAEEWVEVDLLLRTRGGYHAFLARPSRR